MGIEDLVGQSKVKGNLQYRYTEAEREAYLDELRQLLKKLKETGRPRPSKMRLQQYFRSERDPPFYVTANTIGEHLDKLERGEEVWPE